MGYNPFDQELNKRFRTILDQTNDFILKRLYHDASKIRNNIFEIISSLEQNQNYLRIINRQKFLLTAQPLKTLRYKVFAIGSYITKNGNDRILKLSLAMKLRS